METQIFVADNLTEGQRARLARLSLNLRQVDVASLAKVSPCEVTAFEKDRYVRPQRKLQILKALGLIEDDSEQSTN